MDGVGLLKIDNVCHVMCDSDKVNIIVGKITGPVLESDVHKMNSELVETLIEGHVVSDGVIRDNLVHDVSQKNLFKDSGEFVKLFQRNVNQPEFTQGMIHVHEMVKKSGVPNYVGLKMPVFSGINCDFLDQELYDYEDRIISLLMRYGAPISHMSGIVDSSETHHRNHSGARLFPDDIDQYIVKEV